MFDEISGEGSDAIENYGSEYLRGFSDVLSRVEVTGAGGVGMTLDGGCVLVVDWLKGLKDLGGKVLTVGNGGSASIAGHLQNDLAKSVGVRAMALQDFALVTAITNDEGYHRVYADQILQWGDRGDLLIAISSSGESENILEAVDAARARSMRVMRLAGFAVGNALRGGGEINFYVPDETYGFVELAHGVMVHLWTDALRRVLDLERKESHDVVIKTENFSHRRGGVRRSGAGS